MWLRKYVHFEPITFIIMLDCFRDIRRFLGRLKLKIIRMYYENLLSKNHYTKIQKELSRKQKIKVAFLLIIDTTWKYDELYWLLAHDELFEPIVVICPWTSYSEEVAFDTMKKVSNFCIRKKYNFVSSFDSVKGTWIDIREAVNPDIVFYTYPYIEFTLHKYYITHFLDKLTCYATYGFSLDRQQQRQFNLLFHNLAWKVFYETTVHQEMAQKYANNKGINVCVSGYPLYDELDRVMKNGKVDVWKPQDCIKKRIIWAPHHTVVDEYNETLFSCFTMYSEFFLHIAKKYRDIIQIAFKPHPKLRPKLYKLEGWGKERTDDYYSQWIINENTQLEEGDYINLFLSSDALILDSISFICEYMYTNNPILFTVKSKVIETSFNEFGQIAFNYLYKGCSPAEIENFIVDVVLGGSDIMKDKRKAFYEEYLLPPNKKTASRNIYETLKEVVYK